MVANPLGAKGAAAESAVAELCLQNLPTLELLQRAATPVRRVVPYEL
jgi:hypothetical protein